VKKGVTKALKEYFEASKRKHLAAIKIQAVFRGYQVRKMLKKVNGLPLKSNNYANTETVDGLCIKCLPATSAEPETGSASLIHEKFRSHDPQQLDILGKYLIFICL
jgi:IQ calmodulin-binding motif.